MSSGLLQNMSSDEVEAVLAHEVSYVANGAMVTLTLIQGVVNTFVMFLARIIGFFVDSLMRGNQQQQGGVGIGYFLAEFLFDPSPLERTSDLPASYERELDTSSGAKSTRADEPPSNPGTPTPARWIDSVPIQTYDQNADPQAGYAMVRPDGSCPACDSVRAVTGGR